MVAVATRAAENDVIRIVTVKGPLTDEQLGWLVALYGPVDAKYASLDFVREKNNVVFIGPRGVGKTHLANAIGQLACLRGYLVRNVVAADLVNDLVAGQAKNTLHRRLAAWAAPDLLLIDELGYLSFDARGADLLYQVFNKRYQRSATIVTTNLPFKDWGKLFHNSAAASAIADRLVHRGMLVRITGKSKRSDQEVDAAA